MKSLNLAAGLLVGFIILGIPCKANPLKVYVKPVPTALERKLSPAVVSPNRKKAQRKHDKYKQTLVRGILALRGQFRHVTRKYATRLVEEALEVLSKPENRWMPVHILLGLAINESDLRWWIVTGSRSQPDCGICQNHTPLFVNGYWNRRSMCRKLRNTKMSLDYAMRELNMYKQNWCKRYFKKPRRRKNETLWSFNKRVYRLKMGRYRCLYSLYNQGPSYLKGSCAYRNRKYKSDKVKFKKHVRHCWWRNLYWVRGICFARGVRLGRSPAQPCRRALGLWWINLVYKTR